jgi:hypothetical protein
MFQNDYQISWLPLLIGLAVFIVARGFRRAVE